MLLKFRKWWIFHIQNPSIRKGVIGGFKFDFKRYELIISTLSGNWKARWTAAEHPYGYLICGQGDENIEGFCQTMYEIGMLLTTDQGFVDDIQKALKKYSARLGKAAEKEAKTEDEVEEKAALEFEKGVQEYVERKKGKKAARSLQ